MITSPTIAQILKGIVHEMSTSLKDGLEDPIKLGQIDTICGVLSACAVRADHETDWMDEEIKAIMGVGLEFLSAGKATADLDRALKTFEPAASSLERYDAASNVLSLMSDIGSDAGDDLSNKVWKLMQQRLTHEGYVIGGGFESAGRG